MATLTPAQLHQRAQDCLDAIQKSYSTVRVPVIIRLEIPRNSVHVRIAAHGESILSRRVPAFEVVPAAGIIRIHPHLARSNPPRYVLEGVFHHLLAQYVESQCPEVELSPFQGDPQHPRINDWLHKHGFPPHF